MAASIKWLDKDGVTQVVNQVFGDAFAGRTQTPKKLLFENTGDRQLNGTQLTIQQVGDNDGADQLVTVLDTESVSKPYGGGTGGALVAVLSAAGAGGVWGTTGIRGYVLTATNANGETIKSAEVTVNVDVVTKKVTVSWTQTPGATGYKLYRTDTPGTYGASSLRTTIGSGSTTSFVDDGSATASGTPATTNTTGGWNLTTVLSAPGAGGAWPSTGNRYWRVAALDSTDTILAVTHEAVVNIDNITKKVTLSWLAISGASKYQVFRSTASGSYLSPAFVATVTAPSVTFDDVGNAVASGQLIETPNYGRPPSNFDNTNKTVGNVVVGQQVFFWVNRVVPASVPEVGNPRLALLAVKET